ncbi:MAG TPA: protein kinase [Vicinamibacterales bacterium]|nr:protein kinase [Vicinamibacterales bacterium]
MGLTTGTRLGPYEIVSPIGAGGMGEVYRAHDTRLNRDVAIKVLPASFANDAERRARFEREAQAVASLSHPNVLAIHDTGVHDGQMFVVTELLEGETLAERLKTGALPLRKALDTAVQIARGLAAAHDKHVVHRDLKPENLFLLRDGRVKILDFGLARHLPSVTGATQTVPAATDPGVVMGTVGYMAPEQVRGETVDARADLFAFGAVLYEMLAGQRAFRRDTAAETMTAILREDPPELLQQRADLSPALDRIVRHSLEKDPSERFQSARDIAFALESLSGPSPVTSAQPPVAPDRPAVSRSSRAAIYVAIAAIAVAAVALLWSWRGASPGDTNRDVPISIGAATQVTADDGLEIDSAISPDGRMLAYSSGTATSMRVFIRPVGGGRTITLSDDPQPLEYQPRWSPDGSQILYMTPAGAFVASALGGRGQRVAASPVDAASWASDGKRILIVRGDALSVIGLNGGEERRLGTAREPHSCSWSPNDSWIACASGNRPAIVPGLRFGNISPTSIVLFPATGGDVVELTARTTLNQSPVWSPDGRQLYFVSNRQGPRDIYVMDLTDDGRVRGEPRRVTTGLGVHSMAFSAKGERLTYVIYTARANLWSLPVPTRGVADTTGAKVVTTGNQIIESVSVSPDGRWLVYDSNLHLNADIFRVPFAGGTVERLTTDPADDFSPELSPDGSELTYHSWRSGSRDIFVKKIDGGSPQQLTSTPSQESYPIWSPDGRAIAFLDQTIEGGSSRGLFVIRRDGSGAWGPPEPLRASMNFKPLWSRDGRSIAYPRRGALEVIDVESKTVRVVYAPSGPADPPVESVAESDDGETLYFKSHDAEQRASLWSVPLAGGRPRLLVRFNDLAHPSIRPDFAVAKGQLFFTLEDRQADIWVAEIARR